jgi:hypothetical protein
VGIEELEIIRHGDARLGLDRKLADVWARIRPGAPGDGGLRRFPLRFDRGGFGARFGGRFGSRFGAVFRFGRLVDLGNPVARCGTGAVLRLRPAAESKDEDDHEEEGAPAGEAANQEPVDAAFRGFLVFFVIFSRPCPGDGQSEDLSASGAADFLASRGGAEPHPFVAMGATNLERHGPTLQPARMNGIEWE